MEIQASTKSEPKPVSSHSYFGRGRLSSPATALSAHEREAIQESESWRTNLTYFDCRGLCCQLEGEVITSCVKNRGESCWMRVFPSLAQLVLEDTCVQPV